MANGKKISRDIMKNRLDEFIMPSFPLSLNPGHVHVWSASLDPSDSDLRRFERVLSLDEREKAERYAFKNDRRRFVAGRGILRSILALYLGTEPADLVFEYGSHGKPRLTGGRHRERLDFNLSRSKDRALYIFSLACDVGVDIEYMRELGDREFFAEGVFSEREIAEYRFVPEEMKRKAFFNGWTRKEAFAKALGKGLFFPFDSFDVTVAPGAPARLLGARDHTIQRSPWSIRDIQLGPDYAGAMAVKRLDFTALYWRWVPPAGKEL